MNATTDILDRQGELKWEAGNWGHVSVAEPHSFRLSHPNQVDWDWNGSMILSRHTGGGSTDDDAIPKSIAPESISTHLRPLSGILSSGFPSNFSQNPVGIFGSSGVTSFGDISTSVTPRPEFHDTLSSPNISGIPGLAPTKGGHGNSRHPFEFGPGQYFGLMHPEEKLHTSDFSIKREIDTSGSDGHASRLGLNLGVRTYFSTEETGVGRLGKRHRANSPGSQMPMCQAEGCRADLSTAKHYHRRHKVCEIHSKASDVIAAGQIQRFCQQCSRFHILSEFDEGKRSCRKRLADHNRRRRKPQQTVARGKVSMLEPAAQKVDEKRHRISASTGQTSIFIQLQQSGSPSSVSMGDSDDKTSAGNVGVQLLASSSGFEQHRTVLNSHGSPGSIPSSHSMLQGIGMHSGARFVHQNAPQLSVLSGGVQDKTLYHPFFSGIAAKSGTTLSLSSTDEDLQGSSTNLCEKSKSASEAFVTWSRSIAPGHEVMQTNHSPPVRLQLPRFTPPKEEANARQEISRDQSSVVQVFPGSIQNIPTESRTRWIAREQDGTSCFDSFSLNDFSAGEQMSGLQRSRLGKSAEAPPQVNEEGRADEFVEHRGDQRGVDNSTMASGSDIKFLEMQGLSPGSFGPTFL